ncbi:fungal-specific transcription factor domain-domain-containing protein [Naematelia encephala]|uniref:Fungal-specific transcription factor domain-domain-containing protein n=1 Tax=Naematelia encephala TaxID=71784 RepID=A0A1Y2B5K9_9TREE|nr:fungal-specific transcription factor domain-domain-containing protein [Naematelia encephala]
MGRSSRQESPLSPSPGMAVPADSSSVEMDDVQETTLNPANTFEAFGTVTSAEPWTSRQDGSLSGGGENNDAGSTNVETTNEASSDTDWNAWLLAMLHNSPITLPTPGIVNSSEFKWPFDQNNDTSVYHGASQNQGPFSSFSSILTPVEFVESHEEETMIEQGIVSAPTGEGSGSLQRFSESSVTQVEDWVIPPDILNWITDLADARQAELVRHCFTDVVPMWNTIDHPKHPLRLILAEWLPKSPPLFHAVLAMAAVNKTQSAEARHEALLWYETALDELPPALAVEAQDDTYLSALAVLVSYSAFDSGTYSDTDLWYLTHKIVITRLDELNGDYTRASLVLRFTVYTLLTHAIIGGIGRRLTAADAEEACLAITTKDWQAPGTKSALYVDVPRLLHAAGVWEVEGDSGGRLSGITDDYSLSGVFGVPLQFHPILWDINQLLKKRMALESPSVPLDYANKVATAKDMIHAIRNQQSKIKFARLSRVRLPKIAAADAAYHRRTHARFFEIFRLGALIHLLVELQDVSPYDVRIQNYVREMSTIMTEIGSASFYHTSALWAYFIAGCCARKRQDRSIIYAQIGTATSSPSGNVWALRDVMQECWVRNDDLHTQHTLRLSLDKKFVKWRQVTDQRGWSLITM